MTEQEEKVFEAKAEKYFKSHRELPCGRNFLCFQTVSPESDKKYKENHSKIFPNSPGAEF